MGVSLVLFAITVGDPHRVQAQTKPNILVIIGDHVGWMNVASYGGDIMGVKTPDDFP
jgi:arylsulfatase A-like enzyme